LNGTAPSGNALPAALICGGQTTTRGLEEFAMSIRVVFASVFAAFLALGPGCDNEICEEGSVCLDGEEVERFGARECLMYCARLSTCGAPQAEDFDGCVEDCEHRFKDAPRETAELCACSEWSACDDLVEGRCSRHPGAGGRDGSGGSSTAGTAGQGGGAGSGGSSCGGAGGSSTPSDAGVAGTGGSSPLTCNRDCDCPLPDLCRGGVCVPPEAAN
jgi:hypothetical protein